MRLWHKDLIRVLPRQQLLGQWRECCLIAKEIKEKGTPNHLLVNRIMKYPMEDFYTYGYAVFQEMYSRGYKVDLGKFNKYFNFSDLDENNVRGDYFKGWHNDRYLKQCYYNLQEKFDCGGIPENEWVRIWTFMDYRQEENESDGRTIFADPGYFNQSKERADEDCERG